MYDLSNEHFDQGKSEFWPFVIFIGKYIVENNKRQNQNEFVHNLNSCDPHLNPGSIRKQQQSVHCLFNYGWARVAKAL